MGQINLLTFPSELLYLMEPFYEARGGSEGRLTLRDLAAWSALSGISLTSFDTDILLRLDAAFVRVQAEPMLRVPGSLMAQLKQIKEHEDNIKSGIRMKYVNPRKA